MALVWNFPPYSTRARHEGLGASPFEELNGFQYHIPIGSKTCWLSPLSGAGELDHTMR
jgi:hypothetical protein